MKNNIFDYYLPEQQRKMINWAIAIKNKPNISLVITLHIEIENGFSLCTMHNCSAAS